MTTRLCLGNGLFICSVCIPFLCVDHSSPLLGLAKVFHCRREVLWDYKIWQVIYSCATMNGLGSDGVL